MMRWPWCASLQNIEVMMRGTNGISDCGIFRQRLAAAAINTIRSIVTVVTQTESSRNKIHRFHLGFT